MGMSTYVKGFVPPDEHFMKMKKIWDLCEEVGLTIHCEVYDFFGDEEPDKCGRSVDIPCKVYGGVSEDGIEVYVNDIPSNVKIIRFYNSY